MLTPIIQEIDMEDRAIDTAAAATSDTGRKIWRKPEPTVLPVEETATGSSTGNDGNTPTTHS